MSDVLKLGEIVTIARGTTYSGKLVGEPGAKLLGLGSIIRDGGYKGQAVKSYGGLVPSEIEVQEGELYASLKDVTQTADVLGAVARLPKGEGIGRLTQDTVRLDIVNGSGVESEYIYWMLRTPQYRQYCRAHATGTTTMGLSRRDFLSFEIPVPDDSRSAIVELLGALDDKIAANERVVSTAETLADALFHQSSSDISPGPSAFQDVASVEGGGTPKTKVEEYWGDDIAWATPTDVTQLSGLYLYDTSRKLTEAGLDACSSRLHPAGSILMTSRATIGALAIAAVPMAVNQGFIVANATDPDGQWWLYHEMKSRVPEFLNFANGATFMELPRGKFKQIPARWPGQEKLRSFNVAVSEIHERGRAAGVESASLARTRDELLPLLMSGKITVKDAEAVVSDAV